MVMMKAEAAGKTTTTVMKTTITMMRIKATDSMETVETTEGM